VACFISLLSWALPGDCETTADRCLKYRSQVIREARYRFGLHAEWWLFLGQLKQESGCRRTVTAFDQGRGLAQFMDATAEWLHSRETALQEISERPSPYDTTWSIRALIIYDEYLYGAVICEGWYYALRAYNGGAGLLNREIRRAGSCETSLVEQQCARKKRRLKSGKILDFCQVNIRYPHDVIRKGEGYRK